MAWPAATSTAFSHCESMGVQALDPQSNVSEDHAPTNDGRGLELQPRSRPIQFLGMNTVHLVYIGTTTPEQTEDSCRYLACIFD